MFISSPPNNIPRIGSFIFLEKKIRKGEEQFIFKQVEFFENRPRKKKEQLFIADFGVAEGMDDLESLINALIDIKEGRLI